MSPPRCPCHGEPMYRQSYSRANHWGCRVKKRARDNVYLLTDKGRARARRFRLADMTHYREDRIKRIEELRDRTLHRED